MINSIENWNAGNEDAFESMFHQYKNMVGRTAYMICGNSDEAEEIIQDVFVKAWRSRYSFDPQKGSLATWLYRITVNVGISKKRKKRVATSSMEAMSQQKARIENQDISQSHETTVIEDIEHERVIRALNSLNGIYRPVITLKYLEELSYNEISEILEIPLGTVKSRLNEAMRILRRELDTIEERQ